VAGQARRLAAQGAFRVVPALSRRLGGGDEAAETVLLALGYRRKEDESGVVSFRRAGRKPRRAGPGAKTRRKDRVQKDRAREDSPFAVLKDLATGNRP